MRPQKAIAQQQAKIRPPGASGRNGQVPPERTRWKKGQSGNPKGRPPGESITAALRARLEEQVPGLDHKTYKAMLVDVLLREGMKGKPEAIREILDRTEGKAKQTQELTGDITVHYHFPKVAKPPG